MSKQKRNTRATRKKSRKRRGQQFFALDLQGRVHPRGEYHLAVNATLYSLVRELDPTVNVITSATSTYYQLMKSSEPPFLKAWRKFGPQYLSSDAMRRIEENVGITNLNRTIAKRLEARAAGNWPESDRLRDELRRYGIGLRDSKDPNTGAPQTTWEIIA
jgi:cysteinyl-tRNA synthetase